MEKTNAEALGSARRSLALFALVLSGEAIFFLPFVIPRVFRPTFLEVFGIDNLELGVFISVYGVVAVVSYFFGGFLADRFPAGKLMAVALGTTGAGGLLLALFPPTGWIYVLYGFWGASTILLFWAAMMRATRTIGGLHAQGRAFGILDGGRGLVAAVVGSLAVAVFAWFLPAGEGALSAADRTAAFRQVILFFTAMVFLAMLLVRWALKPLDDQRAPAPVLRLMAKLPEVLRMSVVRYQALIILCAYSGYRVADDFPLLAKDVLGYSEVDAAGVAAMALWIRPVAAVLAGVIGDRTQISSMTFVSFLLMAIGGLAVGLGPVEAMPVAMVFLAVVSTSLGVFALRGLYFAIMQEGHIPPAVTGTAVGLASVVGYLPDVYMGPIMGVLLDGSPGLPGHRYVFLVSAAFALLGMVAVAGFRRLVRKQEQDHGVVA